MNEINKQRANHLIRTHILVQALLHEVEEFTYPNDFQRDLKIATNTFDSQLKKYCDVLERHANGFTNLFGKDVDQSQNFIDCVGKIEDFLNTLNVIYEH